MDDELELKCISVKLRIIFVTANPDTVSFAVNADGLSIFNIAHVICGEEFAIDCADEYLEGNLIDDPEPICNRVVTDICNLLCKICKGDL